MRHELVIGVGALARRHAEGRHVDGDVQQREDDERDHRARLLEDGLPVHARRKQPGPPDDKHVVRHRAAARRRLGEDPPVRARRVERHAHAEGDGVEAASGDDEEDRRQQRRAREAPQQAQHDGQPEGRRPQRHDVRVAEVGEHAERPRPREPGAHGDARCDEEEADAADAADEHVTREVVDQAAKAQPPEQEERKPHDRRCHHVGDQNRRERLLGCDVRDVAVGGDGRRNAGRQRVQERDVLDHHAAHAAAER
mmetsp:Transcript_6682/g.23760  ORF Transcript_6682/g.23760 Transcript_6682/m.23760 type:complete len:254 (+) Transcript_6682:1571-2332(+)